MLSGLLGRGFVPKGKSLIKLTKSRIDVLRRKRTATIKFLKKDLADLLANGLDDYAYGRAGGLLDELKHAWNLDFVESSCDFVYKHLSLMQEMRECPEDCREAVSSLMFAASAFSELPELRDLRQMFHDKYGDSLELLVNKELVESLSAKPSSLEKKVKLMEDVASEFSIPWDSNAFEQRISRHNSTSVKELNKNHRLPNASNDKYKSIDDNKVAPIRKMYNFSSLERSEGVNGEHGLNRRNAGASEKEIYQNSGRGDRYGFSSRERSDNVHRSARSASGNTDMERNEFRFESRSESSRENHNSLFNDGDTIVMKIKHERLLQRNGHQKGMEHTLKKMDGIASRTPKPSSSSERHEELPFASEQKNLSLVFKQENCVEHVSRKSEDNASRTPKPSSSSETIENIDHRGSRHCNDWENRENAMPAGGDLDRSLNGSPGIASETHHSKSRDYWGIECDYTKLMRKVQEEQAERQEAFFNNALPPPPYVKPNGKARSSKAEAAAFSKIASDSNSEMAEAVTHLNVGKNVFVPERANDHDDPPPEDPRIVKRRTSSRRREQYSRRGLLGIFSNDELDGKDDEEIMLDSLLMHYSRKPSSYDEMRTRQESESRRSDTLLQRMSPPVRTHPVRDYERSEPSEPSRKVFARSASHQPERSNVAKHVHPMLPDYEELAARFATLKGR